MPGLLWIAGAELYRVHSTFITAGTDTTSNALARMLHLMCDHPDVQEKLREEIIAARTEQGELDYDALMALPLLDAVCRETMRCFPPVVGLSRM